MEGTMNIKQKLAAIQSELKAPKNLRNSFGNYNYRNCEGILEAYKKYEKEYAVALTLDDTINIVGDRFYVIATATLMDCESSDSISVSAYARESAVKKGMDDSQITGSASSYARKYALNGLFLLDDTKDADTDEQHIESEARAKKESKAGKNKPAENNTDSSDQVISQAKCEALNKLLVDNGISLETIYRLYNVKSLKELTEKKHQNVVTHLNDIKKKQEETK